MASNRLPLTFILATVVIDAMGIGLIFPVMPELIREVHASDIASAAIWGGILTTSFSVMQFLFSPALGSISDRFGRRSVLLISLGFLAIDYLIMALASSIWLLLIARMIGGIASATHATASAYVADISAPEEKATRFGYISAAFGFGFILGPILGGFLGELGTRAPFFFAAGLSAANMLFGYLVMPETLRRENRRPVTWRRSNPLGALASVSALPGLGLLLVVYFVYTVAFAVYPTIWSFFVTARFDWPTGMIGLSLGAFGLSIVVVQGGLIRIFLKRLGEAKTVTLGLAFSLVGFIVFGFVESGTLALILTPITALGAIVTPAIQGILSRKTPDDSQGELQGVLTSINSLAMIIAPLMMTQVFWAFTRDGAPFFLPGAPFLLSAAFAVLCIVIFQNRPRQ